MMSVTARVADKGISLVLSDDVLDVILSESYNPVCIASFFQNKEHSFLMRFDKTNIACFLADVWCKAHREVGGKEHRNSYLEDAGHGRSH
jgi:hypothetical protein